MNAERRKKLTEVLSNLSIARAELENLRDEEEEVFDAMPESIQSGERGQKAEAAVDALQEAVESLESAESNIETAGE